MPIKLSISMKKEKKSSNLAVDIYEETSIYQSKNYKYTAFFFYLYTYIYLKKITVEKKLF